MACKKDIENAILDGAYRAIKENENYVINRISYSRLKIIGVERESGIAYIADGGVNVYNLVRDINKKLKKLYKGHVIAIANATPYHSLDIILDVNLAYVEREYKKYLEGLKSKIPEIEYKEGNQYFVNGEVYPTYEDALNALNRDNYSPNIDTQSSSSTQNHFQERKLNALQNLKSNPEFIQDAKEVFENSEELQEAAYDALGFRKIPTNIESLTSFENTAIEYVDHIGKHADRRNIGARNINKGERIKVVLSDMKEKFRNKTWLSPANSEPLPEDAFKSFEEFMMFMYLHEKAHEYILREEGETLKSYETRVNNEALRRLNSEFRRTPQQKQQALDLYIDYAAKVESGEIKTGKEDVQGFKDFVNGKQNEDDNFSPDVRLPYTFKIVQNNNGIKISAVYNGQTLGHIDFFKNHVGQYRVNYVEVNERERNKKIGLNLYKEAIRYATNKGSVLIPDEISSMEAAKIYRNLEKEGLFKIDKISEQLDDGRYAIEGKSTGVLPEKSVLQNDSNNNYSPNIENEVEYSFKVIDNISNNLSKVNQWFKQLGNTDKFWQKLQQDLQIPKQQMELLRESFDGLEKSKPDVILPIGTSGSGKSTFIKSLPQENLVVIEPDVMRAEFTGDMNDKSKDKEIYEEAAKRAINAIKQGKQVVFDTTNLTKEKRRPFIEAIKKEIPNANIQYKLMPLNPELAKQRIKAQLERGENRANVSDATIDRHAESYKQMLEDIKDEPISNFENQSTPTIEDALIDFASNYSYTVEINTAGEKVSALNNNYDNFNIENDNYQIQFFQNDWELGIEKYLKNNKEISQDEYGKAQSKYEELKGEQFKPTQHYSNLTVPGGTNYTENEIATPAITPSIKGHAQFSTDNGIGWFRSDEQVKDGIDISTGEEFNPFLPDDVPVQKSITTGGTLTKTRRILEVQSDLFQKGRDKEKLVGDKFKENHGYFELDGYTYAEKYDNLTREKTPYKFDSKYGKGIAIPQGGEIFVTREEYEDAKEKSLGLKDTVKANQFLQLLNKDNNWVTFFVKSIIQDSAKKGYEKVLFPSGNTASKVEGHSTLEEFKKQKEDRIKELEKKAEPYYRFLDKDGFTKNQFKDEFEAKEYAKISGEKYQTILLNTMQESQEIKQLKQELERVEKEGFAALRPIYNFYENTVANILKKQGYNPMEIVDEYGNMWNEVEVDESARNTISFSPDINDEQERDYENTNSGPNTFDTVEQGPLLVSDYTTYIEVKKAQLGGYMNKLRDNIKEQESAGVSPQRLSELHREERALRLEIYGNKELEIKGIKDEIAELEDNANTNSVAYYIERELERLAKLSVSQSPRDITEARRIIDLLVKAGTFSSEEENPFFDQNVIFEMDSNGGLTSTYLLDERTRNTFAKWRAIAEGFKNIVDKTSEEIAVNTIKGNSLIQNTYRGEEQGWTAGTIFNKETGLKDTDWFSMWFLDPTHGLLSTNGIVPQVMIANLVKSLESKERWSREMAEYMDRNSARVNSALMEMGETTNKFGIVGIKTGVYNIFKRLTAEGNETHDLVQRQTKEYDDETSSAIRKFWIEFKKASAIPTFIDRNKKANIAFRKLKEQRRKSSIIVDVARLEDEEYLQSLINLLGERDFEALLDEQLKAIDEYNKDRQTAIEVLLLKEEVNTYEELSEGSKNQIKFWDARNSPYVGVKDYYSVGGMTYGDIVVGNYMKYNKFIPRKYKANITVDDTTRTYKIEDTKELTGYWDENYLKIHSNKVVSDFYYKLKEFCEKMYEELPYDIKESSQVYTFPGLVKTTAEVINTHTEVHEGLSRWSRFYHSIWDRLRTSFGVIKESTMSYTARDPITGKDPYTVNDSFFRQNHRAIEDRKTIEKTKFLQAFNSTAKIALPRILRGTELYLSQLNTASLIQLAEYLHVDITVAQIQAGNIEAIKNKLKAATVKRGDYIVPIGRLIQDYSKHVIVQSLSFDLPKLVKHFSELAMAYSARKDALPINSILKEHYSKIKAPETTSTGETIWKRVGNLGKKPKLSQKGARVNANRQLEEHFERVHLNKYNKQHHWAIGRLNKVVSPDQENVINKKIAQLNEELKRYDINNKRYKEIKNKIYRLYSDKLIPFMGRNIYTTEERLKVGQLRELIEKEKNKETITKLQDAIDKLGKIRTVTATLDNFLNWVRFLRLGYNVSSGVTNFAEGLVSNLILGATDEYFDTKELYWAYRAVPQSFVKNGTLGWWTTPVAKKTRMLADKYNLIVDSRNILQKNYSDRFLSATNSFAINQRTEYINQTPLMIAVLRTMKITGINGQESSVWDALDTNGNLRQEFRTEENVKNWESLTGETYQNFKNKVNELIMIGHGNYSKLRGMMIKSNGLGRMLMMFKTWLPEMIFWRFAAEQDNIFLGKRGFKGRYRSYGGGTGALHGATVGAVLGAFPGMAVGAVLGGTIGALLGRGNQGGIVDNIYETMSATKLLIKKLIGIPVNVATFGERIATNKRWTKKARYFSSSNFTQQDSNNLYANMTDLAIQLLWLALVLVVKKTFWDDDDDAESQDRKIHNVLVNRLLQLSNQAAMYVNPTEMKDNAQNIAVLQYLSDAGKWVGRVDDYIAGRDMENGESRLWKQTRKMFLPGMFRDSFFGIEGSMERVYPKENPWHRYFKSEESIEADRIKRERATLRKHLLDSAKSESGYSELPEEDREEIKKEIEREVNERIPTLSRLKKLGLTREQYEENHE